MNTIQEIKFQNIKQIPLLIKDFLDQKIEGLENQIFTKENLNLQIEKKKNNYSQEQRKVLYETLLVNNKNDTLTDLQKENIQKLAHEDSFTITTGHQLNLFSGPVFFIYKIIQTIKTCQFAKKQNPKYHFIPVFWMATEDHDFEEINHFYTEKNKYQINGNKGGAVGKIHPENTQFIEAFEKEFADTPFGKELTTLVKDCYSKEKNLSLSTQTLVNHLFASYGLLIIDGDNATLKKEMRGIFKEEVLQNSLLTHSKKTTENLLSKYGKLQVNPREINLFYLSESRNRIEKKENKYQIVDKNWQFSEDELIEIIETTTEKISPNAIMRPVYQEKILPNLAYIGGNAEIMYWLEIVDYFKKLHIPFPILIPRNAMLFLKEKTIKKIEKKQLNISDFFGDFEEKIREIIHKNEEITPLLNGLENKITLQFETLKIAAEKTDKSFGNLVSAEEKRQLNSFKRMKKRLLKAEKIKQKEHLSWLQDVYEEVHPNKNWQERLYNFSVFYAEHGQLWIDHCFESMNVEESKLIIIGI